MSTRCNIEIYDDRRDKEKPGAILYHHSDGYPDFMLEKLDLFMKDTYKFLREAGYPYWWDAERVSAVLILLSVEDYSKPLKPFSTDIRNEPDIDNFDLPYRPFGGVPVFQPCLELHGDIDFIYEIHLLDEGMFEIKHREE